MLASYTSGNPPWYSYNSSITKVVVNPGVAAASGCSHLFYNLKNCTEMDLQNLDTSNVTNMSYMFYYCSRLTDLDISNFDTSNVTNMSNMFDGCSKLTDLDVSNFDTSNVTNMNSMFYQCSNLTDLDVSNFDTSNVTYMDHMFSNCSGLTNLDVSNFDTGNVTNMYGMFGGCGSLTDLDVSGFDTSNVTDMRSTFVGCRSLPSLDVSNFDTSSVTSMSNMFNSCSSLFSLDLSGFDTGNVTDMYGMFSFCNSLTSLDLSSFDTGNVTSMDYMFYNCNSLTDLDLSSFNTGNVTNMKYMFLFCSSLINLDLSSFNTSDVTDMDSMFYNCSSLTSLDLSGFDASNATNMYGMFDGCNNLSEVNLNPNFKFDSYNILPTPPPSTQTGKWIKEDETAGPYTPEQLRDNYNSSMAGLWIWQDKSKCTLKFTTNLDGSGAMATQRILPEEPYTLPVNRFGKPGYEFDHWDDGNGRTYEDQATIPANTYEADTTVILTAVLVPREVILNWEEGEAEFYLYGNERVNFSDIPAGTAYQVWEETPNGWVLIEQSNISGTIQPLETSVATFKNQYQPAVTTVQFSGTKTLDGRAVGANDYEFRLTENGNILEVVPTLDGGFFQFSVITYDDTMLGTHVYKIAEVDPGDDRIDYDMHVETVTVEVVDNGDGTLSSTVTYDDDGLAFAGNTAGGGNNGDIVFTNTTRPGTLKITKQPVNQTEANKDDVFTVKIKLTTNGGRPLSDDIYWYYEEDYGHLPDVPEEETSETETISGE